MPSRAILLRAIMTLALPLCNATDSRLCHSSDSRPLLLTDWSGYLALLYFFAEKNNNLRKPTDNQQL